MDTLLLQAWWIFCGTLVYLMIFGFLLLETGWVERKDMVGVATKVVCMLFASVLAYDLLGYHLMYGVSFFGVIGNPLIIDPCYDNSAWRFYQTGFASIAGIIISGAIAGRTTRLSNVLAAALISGVIYPIHGHWIWHHNGWLHDRTTYEQKAHEQRVPWQKDSEQKDSEQKDSEQIDSEQIDLKSIRAHDYAGAGAVHWIGGIAALVGCYYAGKRPRSPGHHSVSVALDAWIDHRIEEGWKSSKDLKRDFGAWLDDWVEKRIQSIENMKKADRRNGPYHRAMPHLAAAGVLILMIGWIGFNGGSVATLKDFRTEHSATRAVLNVAAYVQYTLLAASTGGLATFVAVALRNLFDKKKKGRLFEAVPVLSGTMAGMVAVTAWCDLADQSSAVAVGALGGLTSFFASHLVLFAKLDDPVDAVAVHAGGGFAGMMTLWIWHHDKYLVGQPLDLLFSAVLTVGLMVGLFKFLIHLSLVNTTDLLVGDETEGGRPKERQTEIFIVSNRRGLKIVAFCLMIGIAMVLLFAFGVQSLLTAMSCIISTIVVTTTLPLVWPKPGRPEKPTYDSASAKLSITTMPAHATWILAYRKPAGGVAELAGGSSGTTVTVVSVGPLSPGVTYEFWIVGSNFRGDGPESEHVRHP